MSVLTETNPITRRSVSFDPIKWLVKLNNAYCQWQQLKATESVHLKDMGISRAQANQSFYRHFAAKSTDFMVGKHEMQWNTKQGAEQ